MDRKQVRIAKKTSMTGAMCERHQKDLGEQFQVSGQGAKTREKRNIGRSGDYHGSVRKFLGV